MSFAAGLDRGRLSILLRIAAAALFFDAFVPLSPYLLQPWHLTAPALQAALALGMAASAASQFIAAYWIPRVDLARTHAAAALLVAALAWTLQLELPWPARVGLLASLFAANAVAAAAGRALLRDAVGHQAFQQWTARLYGCLQLVDVLAPLALITLAVRCGWRCPLATLAALLLAAAWLAAGCRARKVVHAAPPAAQPGLLGDPDFLRPALALAVIQSLFSALMLAKPIVLLRDYGFSDAGLAMTLSGLALAMLPGFALASRLTTRASPLRQWRLCQGLLCACSLLLAAAVLFGSSAAYLAACLACAWAFCIGLPLCQALALNRSPEQRAAAAALLGFAQGAGATLLLLLTLLGAGLRPPGQLLLALVATLFCLLLGRLDSGRLALDAAAQ